MNTKKVTSSRIFATFGGIHRKRFVCGDLQKDWTQILKPAIIKEIREALSF